MNRVGQYLSSIVPRGQRAYVLRTIAVRSGQIFCFANVVNDHVIGVRGCTGASMLPTMATGGDLIVNVQLPFLRLVNSLLSTLQGGLGGVDGFEAGKGDRTQGTGIRLGDLVVSIQPQMPEREVSKRVLGLPGDTVLFDPRVESASDPEEQWSAKGKDKEKWQEQGRKNSKEPTYIVVPKGHVWLSGDNLANSTDSRTYGPVPLGLIKGKLIANLYPKFTWLQNPIQPE